MVSFSLSNLLCDLIYGDRPLLLFKIVQCVPSPLFSEEVKDSI